MTKSSTTLDKFIDLSKYSIDKYLLDKISDVIHSGGKEYELAILLHELIEETNSGIQTHAKDQLMAINKVFNLCIDVEYTIIDDTYNYQQDRL